jgi:sugar phosphate isomerase/epimerase
MLTRRLLIKNSAALAMGGLLFPKAFGNDLFPAKPRKLGIQLFTFFTSIDGDVEGTLQKIAAAGYTEIESAFSRKGGFYGMSAKEFSAALKKLGLSWKSHHVIGAPFKMPANAKPPTDANGNPISIPPMKNLRDNYQEIVTELADAGVPYIVCASTPVNTAEEIKTSTEVLHKTGEAAKKAGIQFAYHNHEAEFKTVESIVPYDYFLSQVSADHLKMELDLAWAVKAGIDPVAIFKKHPGRFPLWHVKDIDKEGKVQPVGKGTIDFKPIFNAASTAGLKHFFVEHDMPADAWASINSSKEFLTDMFKS